MLIKDSEGKGIEVFTQEEVNNKIQESIKPLTADLEKAKTDLKAAIDNKGGTDEVKRLTDLVNSKTAEIDGLNKKITSIPEEIKQNALKEVRTEMLEKVAGKDADLTKKIEFYLNEFKTAPTNKKEIQEQIDRAYMLATGGQKPKPGVFDNGVMNMGGSGQYNGGNGGNNGDYLANETANAKAIRNALDISDEDAKKFGKI